MRVQGPARHVGDVWTMSTNLVPFHSSTMGQCQDIIQSLMAWRQGMCNDCSQLSCLLPCNQHRVENSNSLHWRSQTKRTAGLKGLFTPLTTAGEKGGTVLPTASLLSLGTSLGLRLNSPLRTVREISQDTTNPSTDFSLIRVAGGADRQRHCKIKKLA